MRSRFPYQFPRLLSLSRPAKTSRRLPFLSSESERRLSPQMEDPSLPSPITSGDGYLVPDSGSQIGSASGSLKSDHGLLSAGGGAADGSSGSFKADGLLSGSADAEFGFQRPEMGRSPLAGTVGLYERHVFLCYKSPDVWPSHVEAAEFDRLPRLLSAALSARKADMKKKMLYFDSGIENLLPFAGLIFGIYTDTYVLTLALLSLVTSVHTYYILIIRCKLPFAFTFTPTETRLTICEGEDGTESSNGDVLIFPDMIRYRRLTHFDVDNFVEEVLVKDTEWLPGNIETITGSYVFVCAHGSRDRRCGVCGPVLLKKLKEEINSRGIQDQVFASPCSHIGGHKYAGNVIIFSSKSNGEVTGHWYGYVTPDDVPLLLEQHIGKGEIVDHLWRGQMGLSGEDQKKAQNLRSQVNGEAEMSSEKSIQKTRADDVVGSTVNGAVGCCQGVQNSSCCQNMPLKEKVENNHIGELETCEILQKSDEENKATSSKVTSHRTICGMPTWFETWEREDTYAVAAVVVAVASVAVAYSCYRQLK